MTAKVTYNGELRTTCVHLRSGNEFITDVLRLIITDWEGLFPQQTLLQPVWPVV